METGNLKLIYNKFIPFSGYKMMTFGKYVFVRNEYKGKVTSEDINHEAIHYQQQKELYYVFFFILYLLEYLYGLIVCSTLTEAYYNISFEKEAYCNELDFNYLENRKKFSWINYLFKKQ